MRTPDRPAATALLLTVLLFVAFPAFAAGIAEGPEFTAEELKPRAQLGVLDLREHDFDDARSLVELRGDWEFHWGSFLQPGDPRRPDSYLPSGSNWNDGGTNPVRGFASYRLTILLPEDPPDRNLVLLYREVGSAARIYWNGIQVANLGRAASSDAFAQGEWRSGTTAELPWGEEIELIVHVSNFDNINGGLVDNFVIGPGDRVRDYYLATMAMNFFVAGILFIMAVYHLFLFFFRSRDEAPFWFAIAALFLGLRALVVDTFPLTIVLPGILIEPVLRLNYLCFSVPLFAVSMFVHHSYKSEFGRLFVWISGIGSMAYSAMVLFAPLPAFTSQLLIFQIFALAIALGLLGIVVWAVFSRKPLSGSFAIGFLTIMLSAVFDIIKTMLTLPLPSMSSIGMVAFIFILAINLSRRSSKALSDAEELTAQLKDINSAMERFVPREFLKFLRKQEITQVALGDHSEEFLTVLFADLKEFTGIAEESTPEEIFALINDFLAGMGPIIRKYKGFVDKYLGDGIMALFSGNASNAIHAAIEMQQKLDHINQLRLERGQVELAMGVGIHTGSCMLGTIGEAQRMDGTVISDAVNLSARLQNLTRQFDNRILISGEAYEHAMAPEGFYVRNIGSFKVKGRLESVDVIEIINADPPAIWKQKRSTRRDFEKALYYHRQGRTAEARQLFLSCREKAPDDPALRWWLAQLG
jgi:adenylate cyclase